MNKRLILALKIAVMAAVVAFLAWEFNKAWRKVATHHVAIDWRFGGLAILGFSGSMLTSALVWRWLAWKMKDRSPTLPLLGAYTFSQLGKYIPGKVGLLLMRVERAGRFGMMPGVCTLSTILENALYMVSGGLVGMLAILRVTQDLPSHQRILIWAGVILAILLLAVACHPKVFYGLVNRLLRRMKKPEIPASRQLKARFLALAVIGFIPCWGFGGLALWAAARCVYPMPLIGSEWLASAYALSVIMGMASLMPGGLVIRDGVLGAAVLFQLAPLIPHEQAVVFSTVAAALQRVFQIIAELLLGAMGGVLTGVARQKSPADAR